MPPVPLADQAGALIHGRAETGPSTAVDPRGRAQEVHARLLRRTLDAVGEGILAVDVVDLDHPVRLVNQQALRLWQLPAEVEHTLTLQQFLHHVKGLVHGGAELVQRWAALPANGIGTEERVSLIDGRTVHCRCSAADDTVGDVRVWSFRDVSAEVQAMARLQADRQATRAMLDAFAGSIAVLDEHLVYTSVNQRLAQLLQCEVSQILGRSIDEVLGEERAAEVRRRARQALQDGQVVYERQYGARTDQVSLIRGQDPRTGRPLLYAFGVDVSPMKQAQRALEVARDEAQQANLAKSQFLSHMSHELRTPLNAVLGFAQLLQGDSEAPLPPQHQAALQEILRGGRHLLTLINDVLDLGLVEAGRLAFDVKPLPLALLLEECLQMVRPLADQRGVKLRALRADALRLSVQGDATRVKQVLLNLLGNAIKYNRPGGEVRLACQERRHTVRVSVRDTGPGLSALQQSRLFTPFERVHDPAVSVEGTGIGLALCRRLMHGMGGEIGVDSSEGAGSRFWIELPRCDTTGQSAAQAELDLALPQAEGQVHRRQVLYIEDNPVNVVLMQAMLARVPGLVLAVEESAGAGLQHALAQPPDLILMDMQLPDLHGLELLRRLQEHPATAEVPVIAVSANAMDSDVAAGRAAGLADYITKPVDMARLISAVQAALEPARSGAMPLG